ncbi:Clavaminate synthase-like protein [Epithele typhae]|uniref:Clavaminate synthase-like protein n=1 Tax=Epithele typhae TaxID=378194 RepID=UPI002008BC08|nr:Clavaminate synthase-like protein [Epithele typhae]KAH9936752.1 Clavaminate synthase-like protein [Epithele typhae]
MPGLTPCPPFPQDIPTCPLLAATKTGFWHFTNHGVCEEAEGMFAMGKGTISLTLEDRLLFEQGAQCVSFGCDTGVQFTDDKGTHDVPEFVDIPKDDALTWPAVAHRTYPYAVNAQMESTITPFVKNSLAINNHLIVVLNDKLGLPAGTLASLYKAEEFSGCMARFLRAPPYLGPEEKTFLTAHTDFGSLSLLHNRLGGLQVLPPGSDQWFSVNVSDPSRSAALMLTQSFVAQPLPGHAICNVGDAPNIFSGGILRSNIHRVVPPSREQAQYERHSVVFFTRPNDTAPGVTVMERLLRRVKWQRVTNYKGAESWADRRVTEDTAIPNQGKI